jgi:hypothetical protein
MFGALIAVGQDMPNLRLSSSHLLNRITRELRPIQELHTHISRTISLQLTTDRYIQHVEDDGSRHAWRFGLDGVAIDVRQDGQSF